ncbi:MAG: hypothetical protein M3454_02935 [Actinomycetota bacterium]|nr:hypothetical protein [Actinomycetota bacterium]
MARYAVARHVSSGPVLPATRDHHDDHHEHDQETDETGYPHPPAGSWGLVAR